MLPAGREDFGIDPGQQLRLGLRLLGLSFGLRLGPRLCFRVAAAAGRALGASIAAGRGFLLRTGGGFAGELRRLGGHQKDPLEMNNLVGKAGFEELQEEMERMLQRELEKVGDPFLPRQYYIDKWGYRLGEGGYIPYYFEEDLFSRDARDIKFQGPELNRKYRKYN